MKHVTRIAPSPTGDMHLGTARTAYFNWLAAKASGGQFILRVDDTDKQRNREECIEVIIDTLQWLGLDYSFVFYQSRRNPSYTEYIDMLLQHELAFRDDGCVRLTKTLEVAGKPSHLVLRKSDGTPTYHFASVVDDTSCGVTWIIRGTDHESNYEKQKFIADNISLARWGHDEAHNWPEVTHVGLIFKDKKKLSKRDDAASMLWYRDQGYSPEALLNFMLRMGWGPTRDDKSNSIINRDKAVSMFLTEGSMRKAPSSFDQNKLDWYQRKYKHA